MKNKRSDQKSTQKLTKKATKKFTNFKAEEQWLESMFREGWALSGYGSEEWDDHTYRFEAANPEEAHSRKYRIDYRLLKRKEDFEDYRSLFEDAGWQNLAKSARYAKHIFWTDREDAASDIFSEDDSYKQREKRKMKACLTNVASCFIGFLICTALYVWFKYPGVMYAGTAIGLIGGLKGLFDYSKHRRIYRTFP